MTAKIPNLKLANGVEMPQLGYGTWLSNDEQTLREALRAALDAGYRHIDTATFYTNEHVVGEVLHEYFESGKLKRSDVFITTKLPFYGHHCVDYFVELSLKRLRTDYIDLYLIHMPTPIKFSNGLKEGNVFEDPCEFVIVPHIDTWRDIEKFYKKGTFRAIGVCNFNAKQLHDLYDKAEVKPHSLQIEVQIAYPQHELVGLGKKLNMQVTGYGTLGSPGSVEIRSGDHFDCLGHSLVVELAKKYGKIPAQILLRQSIQRGLCVIPKSLNPARIRANRNVFDFELSAEDMARFDTEIKNHKRLFAFYFALKHPMFPFEDVTEYPKGS